MISVGCNAQGAPRRRRERSKIMQIETNFSFRGGWNSNKSLRGHCGSETRRLKQCRPTNGRSKTRIFGAWAQFKKSVRESVISVSVKTHFCIARRQRDVDFGVSNPASARCVSRRPPWSFSWAFQSSELGGATSGCESLSGSWRARGTYDRPYCRNRETRLAARASSSHS